MAHVRGFSAGQAARLAGLKYPTLDYWARSGFLAPSVLDASGKGTARVFSFADVVSLRVAVELRRRGVSLQGLRKVQARLRTYRHLEHPLASARLVIVPGKRVDVARVEITDDDEAFVSLLREPGQALSRVVLELEPAVREVREKIEELEREKAARSHAA